MSLFSKKDEINHLEFVKEFDYENKNIEVLNQLMDKVGDDEKDKIQNEINLMRKGMTGENNVNYYLKNTRIPGYVFHDITMRDFRGDQTQIDFLIITKKFLVVIESKNLFGNIEIDKEGNFYRNLVNAAGKVYKEEGLKSPYTQNKIHIDNINDLLLENKLLKNIPIKSFICLANSQTMIKKDKAPREIQNLVIRTDLLKEKLESLYNYGEYSVKYKEKDLLAFIEVIKSKLVDYKIDYVKKLNLHLMETKIVERETQISDSQVLKERVEEVVPVEQNDELFDALKQYRKDKAKELNYPPYYIFNNDELASLILKNPLSLDELKSLHILDDIKVKKYGEDIIEIIKEYSKEEIKEKEEKERNQVYIKLKAFRFAKSKQLNWKPYQVFNNKVLDELVEKLPSNNEELLEINGLSEKKIEMFGSEILKVIELNK